MKMKCKYGPNDGIIFYYPDAKLGDFIQVPKLGETANSDRVAKLSTSGHSLYRVTMIENELCLIICDK